MTRLFAAYRHLARVTCGLSLLLLCGCGSDIYDPCDTMGACYFQSKSTAGPVKYWYTHAEADNCVPGTNDPILEKRLYLEHYPGKCCDSRGGQWVLKSSGCTSCNLEQGWWTGG